MTTVTRDASLPAHLASVAAALDDGERSMLALSDRIGELAEPGLREYRSAGALADVLAAAGFRVERGVAGMPTAFVAEYGKGRPVIGLMCEYDATPGDSQQPVARLAPVADDACGFPDLHNGIGAASAGAALAIARAIAADRIGGRVRVFGTPAEKICVGKPFMAQAGVFDGLDAMVAWHPRPYTTVEWDLGPGCYEAAIYDFDGVGAYGAAPWSGVSALDGLTLMNVIVQYQREHIPRHYLATLNETITAGGQHPTSLPSHAQAWYVYRSPLLEAMSDIRARLERAANAADLALGTTHRSRIVAATRPWLPNHVMARHCFENVKRAGAPRFSARAREFAGEMLKNLGAPEGTEPFDETLTDPTAGITAKNAGGADDVNEFCWHTPTARIYVAYGLRPGAIRFPNWTGAAFARTDVAHATVRTAARAMAFSVVDAFAKPDVLAEAKTELAERTKGGALAPLLPPGATPPIDDSFPPHYPEDWSPPSHR